METINNILEFEIFRFKEHYLTIFELLIVCLIFLITRLIIWFIGKVIFQKTKLDKGSTFALYQLIKYVIWIMATVFMLEAVGAEYTVILAGSAALLVGIGLGLQSIFTDILSGVILLFEKSIKIDDILEIDGDIIKVQSIGLRTSRGVNIRKINVILPNSLLTTNKVINWSHQTYKTRFSITVGVAYGSDIDLVAEILEKSAMEHPEVLEADSLDVRLIEFGASSLDFQLLFYSQNIFSIEKVRSDIRKIIVRKFHENNITIPFPQLDLNLNSKEGLIEK
jgi:small-conductance mechanosensitive channel